MSTSTDKKPLSCDMCREKYFSKGALQKHKNDEHPKNSEMDQIMNHTKPTCAVRGCGKQFKTKEGLRSHQKSVHGKKKVFSCEECKKDYYSQTGLTYHYTRDHPEKCQYVCGCGQICRSELSLKIHKGRVHKTENDPKAGPSSAKHTTR